MKGLRWWRRARGLTQAELAQASGVERSHLAKIERGEVEEPRTDTLLRLADALGVEVFDLIFGEASIGVFGAPADLRRSPAELRRELHRSITSFPSTGRTGSTTARRTPTRNQR